jgi:hypothetical protein
MDEVIHELADLISDFLGIVLEDEARERLQSEANEMGATYEQFLAMSLTQLITNRFKIAPVGEPGEPGQIETTNRTESSDPTGRRLGADQSG